MESRNSGVRGVLALLIALAVVLGLVGLAPGAARAQEDQEADATLRVVHASPGSPNVDVLIDGQPFATNVAFGSATDYAPLPPGEYAVQVVPSGQGPEGAVIETDLNAEAGQAYIFAAVNPLAEIEGETFQVNLDAVAEGKARARVLHLSPDAGDVSVAVTGGDELFGGVSSGDASDYEDIDPGTLSLDVRNEDDEVIATATGVEIEAGRTYDIVALGQVADQSLTLLPLVTNVSTPCAETLGLEAGAESACVRVVHASPGGPAVDVYVNGSPAIQGLEFGTGTEFAAIPGGDNVQIQVTAAGASLDNAVIDTEQELTAGQAYSAVAIGPLDEIELQVSEVDITPLPEGQARLRVTHASPDAEDIDLGIAEGDTLFEGVGYKDVSEYTVVDAGEYTLQARTGEDTIAVQQDVVLDAGTTYDLFVIGSPDDGTLAALLLAATATEREGGVATPVTSGEPSPVATVAADSVGTPDAEDDTDEVETDTETQVAIEPTETPTP